MRGLEHIIKKTFLTVATAATMFISANAQYNVSGTIRTLDDQVTGAPLANSKVSMDNGAIIAFTDANGHYELTDVPAGTHTIAISKQNYKGFSKTLDVESNITLNGCEPNEQVTNDLGTGNFTAAQFSEVYPGTSGYWYPDVVAIAFVDTLTGDRAIANNALGLVDDWTKAPHTSMTYLMKRTLFRVVPESAARDTGLLVYVHSDGGYTYRYGDPARPGFIKNAESHMTRAADLLFKHEAGARGREAVYGSVSSRPSNFDPYIQTMTDINQIDLTILNLYDNHRRAMMRGEQGYPLESITDFDLEPTSKENILSPVNGGQYPTGLRVKFTSDIQADKYRVLILDAASNVVVNKMVQHADTIFNLVSGLNGSIQVQAINSLGAGPMSDEVSFSINSNLPGNNVITTPNNGATEQPSTLTTAWTQSTNATKYNLEVALDNAFTNMIIDSTLYGITNTSATIKLPAGKTLYERVRGENTQGNGQWATTVSYTIQKPKPGDTEITSQYNGEVEVAVPATFTTSTATNAESYQFRIFDKDNNLKLDTILNNNSFVYGKLATNRQNTIMSRAKNSSQTGDWSSIITFTTYDNAPTVSTISPTSDSDVDVSKDTPFTWYANDTDGDALKYTVEIQNNEQDTTIYDLSNKNYNLAKGFLKPQKTYNYTITADDGTKTGTATGTLNTTITSTTVIENDKTRRAYPNPTTGILNIEGYSNGKTYVEIYSIDGKLLEDITINAYGQFKEEIDLTKYKPGIYKVQETRKGITEEAYEIIKL